ncbi:MAG: hypothetical protein ACRDPB_10095, partial [Nocardioidaceae bacterium]
MTLARTALAAAVVLAASACSAGSVDPAHLAAAGHLRAGHSASSSPTRGLTDALTLHRQRLVSFGADAHGGLLLVTGPLGKQGDYSRALFATHRDPSGHWSVPRSVSGATTRIDDRALAVAPDGSAVLAWSALAPRVQSGLWVRLRSGAGTWSAPQRLAPDADQIAEPRVAVDGRGDAVVAWLGQGPTVAVLRGGAGWQVSSFHDGGVDPMIGIDAAGTVHLADLRGGRGGNGVLQLRRLPVGGSWSAPVTVAHGVENRGLAGFAVDAHGRETVAVGYRTGHYVSMDDDGEDVYPTSFRILRQSRPGGRFAAVWTRPGAVGLSLAVSPGAGRDVWVFWEQWQGRGPHHGPTRSSLLAQQVRPRLGPVRRLGTHRNRVGGNEYPYGRFETTSTAGTAGAGAVLWRWYSDHLHERYGPLRVSALAPNGPARTVHLEQRGHPLSDFGVGGLYPGSVAVAGGHSWVTWEHDLSGSRRKGLDVTPYL